MSPYYLTLFVYKEDDVVTGVGTIDKEWLLVPNGDRSAWELKTLINGDYMTLRRNLSLLNATEALRTATGTLKVIIKEPMAGH